MAWNSRHHQPVDPVVDSVADAGVAVVSADEADPADEAAVVVPVRSTSRK